MALIMPRGQIGFAHPFGELSDSLVPALDDYKQMGARWVRTDFWWNQVRSDNYAAVEKIVARANALGLMVIAELQGQTPNGRDMNNDENVAAYGKWAGEVATRFKGRVQCYELWNEQNHSGFWPNPNPEWYTKALKVAYTAIKAVDPGAIVISGGLSPSPDSGNGWIKAEDFVKRMYAAGGKGYFDALGFHPYSWPLSPEDGKPWNGWWIMENTIRAAMVANGDGDKQIWMTEFGFPTAGGGNAVSEAAQAGYFDVGMKRAASYDWAGPMLIYSWKDRGGNNGDTEAWFGIRRPDGSAKPILNTIKSWASKSQGGTGTGLSSGTPTPVPTPSPDPAQPANPAPVAEPYNPMIWMRGTGTRALRLFLTQQKYGTENAKCKIALDGKDVGTFEIVADRALGQFDMLELQVPAGSHKIDVTFLNDAWGGSEDKDRNLWLAGVYLAGKSLKIAKVIGGTNEVYSFNI